MVLRTYRETNLRGRLDQAPCLVSLTLNRREFSRVTDTPRCVSGRLNPVDQIAAVQIAVVQIAVANEMRLARTIARVSSSVVTCGLIRTYPSRAVTVTP